MRTAVLRLILLLAGAGLNATLAHAQGEGPGFDFAVGGGVILTFGIWHVGDVDMPGWQGTAAVRLLPERLPVGFQVDGTFGRVPAQGEEDIQAQLVYGTGNVVFIQDGDTSFVPVTVEVRFGRGR